MIIAKDGEVTLHGNIVDDLAPELATVVASIYVKGLNIKPEDENMKSLMTELIYACVKIGIENHQDALIKKDHELLS